MSFVRWDSALDLLGSAMNLGGKMNAKFLPPVNLKDESNEEMRAKEEEGEGGGGVEKGERREGEDEGNGR